MSPLDTHLHETLAERAGDVEAPRDLFGLVERRARTLHRRRVALASAGTAAVTALAVVGGLTLTGGSGTDTVRAPITHGGAPTPAPTPTLPAGAISPGPTATGAPAVSRDEPMSWPQVPAEDVAWVQWPAVQRSMSQQLPADFDPPQQLRPLAVLSTDGGKAVLFVAASGGRTVAAAVVQDDPATAVAVHDVEPGAEQVSAVVRVTSESGPVDDGLVVAAPGAGHILFMLPGQEDGRGYSDLGNRWASVTLGHVVAGQPVAQMKVLSGDGSDKPLYEGPIGVGWTFPDV